MSGLLVAGVVAVAVACGNQSTFGFQPAGPDADAAIADAGPPLIQGDSSVTGDANGCPQHCSTDLHSLLDCDGHVVLTCPDDQACAGSGCAEPCAAARANGSAQGCEFYSVQPASYGPGLSGDTDVGSCFAALLANTWTTPITVQVEYAGAPADIAQVARVPNAHGDGGAISYDPLPNGQLAPGALAILFLAGAPNAPTPCPAGVTPVVPDGAQKGTARMHAFHVTTSAPTAAYDIFPYGGASSYVTSATLLIPTSAWGDNYVGADGYGTSGGELPFLQMVGAEDGTKVTIRPAQAIEGGNGIEAAGALQPHTYALAKGEVIQLAQTAELAGSIVSSDKPIGVWGGNNCMNIPNNEAACDSAHQELPAIKALGSDYVAAAYRDRSPAYHETVPWTVTALVDGTAVTFDPPLPLGATITMNAGETREVSTDAPFRVTSDDAHPIHLAAHMTAGGPIEDVSDVPEGKDIGDPDWVNVVPTAQWLGSYVFLTDPTYANTHLVFTRQRSKDGSFADVTLDCVGTVQGWKAIASGSPFEVARVDLTTNGAHQGSCVDGVHTAKSAAPFALTVWGWDRYVSYGFPAGMSVRPINTVVVPPVK